MEDRKRGIGGILLKVIILLLLLSGIGYGLFYWLGDGQLPLISQKEETTSSVESTEDTSLKLNIYPNIKTLVEGYYTALINSDTNKIKEIVDTYEESMVKPDIVENYDNFNIYTKPGLKENEYVVYAEYMTHIVNIKTPVPDMATYYVYYTGSGFKLITNVESNPEVFALVNSYAQEADVQQLFQDYEGKYNQAIESDPDLKTVILMLETYSK